MLPLPHTMIAVLILGETVTSHSRLGERLTQADPVMARIRDEVRPFAG